MVVLRPQTGSADPTYDGVADCGVKVIVILSPGSAASAGLGLSQVSQVSGVYLISPWKILPLISPSAISMQSPAARALAISEPAALIKTRQPSPVFSTRISPAPPAFLVLV